MGPKKDYLSNVTIIPHNATVEAGRFMPKQEIQQMSFLKNVKERDQEFLIAEIRQAAAAKLMHERAGLALGRHIQNIYNRCESYSGTFRRTMAYLGIKERNAYRYMKAFAGASSQWHENVLNAAIVKGLDFRSADENKPLGKYTEVARLLPAPSRNPDPVEAVRYIEQLEQTYKDRKRAIKEGRVKPKDRSQEADDIQRDPEFLLRQNYRGIKNALQHVPPRQRKRWFEKLVGMSLTNQGVASAVMFSPEAIPEDFNQGPGRPSLPQMVHENVA